MAAATMAAFAANSVLNRLALAEGAIDPAGFALIRAVAGAAMLAALCALRRGAGLGRIGWGAAASLATYLAGFSFAYLTLDTGTGALILFGVVQVTMFAGALAAGQGVHGGQWTGAALAFAGLALLLAPTGTAPPDPWGAMLMSAAAVGWGLYSLLGRRATDPLGAAGASFVGAAPLVALVALPFLDAGAVTARGAALAVVSGAGTSALGYALWYRVLPRIEAPTAAVMQLSVPVIAAAGGAMLLGEAVGWRFALTTAMIAGGVLRSLRRP